MISTFTPNSKGIQKDVEAFLKNYPDRNKKEIAVKYANRICWKYASVGVISAIPGTIPGLGTAGQIATEASGIGADVFMLLRWMGAMTLGISYIYEKDFSNNFNEEYIKIIGIWCGVLKTSEQKVKKVGTKVVISKFKKVPATVFKKINRKIGTTIITKYGSKRGGVAVGKLIPFGVGAVVGASFNLATMKTFQKSAINYFENANKSILHL